MELVTDEDSAAACPSCGVLSTSVKECVSTRPKDIPYGEDRILLRWNRTRWRCREGYCTRGSFTEAIEQIPRRARTTGRLRTQIGAAIGAAARSVVEVAAGHGVSWPTAPRAFVAHAEALLTEPAPVRVLGVDETRRGKPRWERCQDSGKWMRVDPWDTGFVDLDGDQGLLGQKEGRTSAAVVEWLRERTPGAYRTLAQHASTSWSTGAKSMFLTKYFTVETMVTLRSFLVTNPRDTRRGQPTWRRFIVSRFIASAREDPMITLCRMVVETRYEDLPAAVVTQAKHCILDTMAVTIGGSAMDGIPAVVELVKDKGGKPESYLPFYGGKVPASEAAMATGPMARAMDLGDTHIAGHVTEYLLPTLLAAAGLKDKVSGKDLITAVVVGQEVLIRIGLGFSVDKAVVHGNQGGHYIFGAVAAAGKLLGLSQEELENAKGIAKAMTQTHDMAMYLAATLMVRVHHGFVSQAAINACLLARKGITGPRQEVLLGRCGLLSTAKWETNPEALTRDLGERWEMLDILRKFSTACHCTHTAIDGIVDQIAAYKFLPEDIANIHIDECTLNWSVVAEPHEGKWNPQTVPECQFSLPYVVATAAYDGEVFLTSFTPQARARPEVRELMTRITAAEDSSLPWLACRVTTTLKDGRKYSNEHNYPRGHPKSAATEQDLVSKFSRCSEYSAYPLSAEVQSSMVEDILNLERVSDVESALLMPLVPRDGREPGSPEVDIDPGPPQSRAVGVNV